MLDSWSLNTNKYAQTCLKTLICWMKHGAQLFNARHTHI
jgi:hypothetical protein